MQINLHAFVINLFGVLDNLAWVYVLENGLEKDVGGYKGVGLFIKATQKNLPKAIQDHLDMKSTKNWYEKYVKNYRDALAHRIPLYVPPLILSDADGKRWKELETKIWACIKNHEFELLDELKREQDSLGVVCDMFSHSFSETESKSIYIHPQLLVDAATILEIGKVYVENFSVHA